MPVAHSHHAINGAKPDHPETPVRPVPVTRSPDRPGHPPSGSSIKPVTPARPTQAPVVPPTGHPPVSSIFANTHVTSTESARGETSQPTPSGPSSTSVSGSGSMLGMLKGGAGNLFRNLRDASTKVIEQVSAYVMLYG
ncbi:unnamed protein product [Echinostoma caproni]|uniref:Translation initiation factor IF-2 n=1 Tax=Echinostoma caproni TaxID=27848 RepID=A0A183B9X4_9TREM|nr:unnamed protein product [Echinostoma caproni]